MKSSPEHRSIRRRRSRRIRDSDGEITPRSAKKRARLISETDDSSSDSLSISMTVHFKLAMRLINK